MRIILVGFGVVGQSFAHLLTERESELIKKYGFNPRVVAIVDRGGAAINPTGLDLEKMLALKRQKNTVAVSQTFGHPTMSALRVVERGEAEAMVEATPTNIRDGEPGLSHIKTAFKNGINVVTSNKGPLATALPALTELAAFNDVYLRFSGTVGAGTPVLELGKKCLFGDNLVSIRGVLNGTTNYILTEMDERHITFQQALEKAQNRGYAETDPSMDVDGFDSAGKLVILANWVMNKKVTLKDVSVRGIREVTPEDLEVAAERNCTIKLVGSINDKLEVKPIEIDRHDPLAVGGVLNAVTFVSKFAGEETIIGRGAGGMETASAILRDLLDINRTLAKKLIA